MRSLPSPPRGFFFENSTGHAGHRGAHPAGGVLLPTELRGTGAALQGAERLAARGVMLLLFNCCWVPQQLVPTLTVSVLVGRFGSPYSKIDYRKQLATLL